MALIELSVRNFAIIKHLELELEDGLTVVTGETGAGKSIILDALNLLLGARAESEQIRHQEDQCEITALFSIAELNDVQQWLQQRDLSEQDLSAADNGNNYCLIRRVIRRSKPTKCYINDQPTTLASLKELGLMLVDIHGQHEHQSLLRLADQRRIIDQFANHADSLKALATLSAKINRLKRELNQASQNHGDARDRMDLMSFQLNELEEANIVDGEFEELELEYARLANAQDLLDAIDNANDELNQNENVNIITNLGRISQQLSKPSEYEPIVAQANDMLNSSLAQMEEASALLNQARSKVEQNPERLREVELRRDLLINLARKHRCSEAELTQRFSTLNTEFNELKDRQDKPEKLNQEIKDLSEKYQTIAHAVSTKRQAVAANLSSAISEQMQDLGMKGGKLKIQVEAQIGDSLIITEHGIDRIEFMVSTNYGMPLKSLNKTASGGELSRISLAIQVITSEKSDTPTLVFDEVDVGVGGKVAQIVGSRLNNLGRNAQVICITHQAQVASQGQQHLLIDKVSNQDETFSTIHALNKELRLAEIARMLGGEVITDRTLAHAQEMLGSSNSQTQS